MKNIAVIGTGYWGKNLVRNFHSLESLKTICDVNPEAVKTFCELYSGIKGTISFVDVLADKLIQGVARQEE